MAKSLLKKEKSKSPLLFDFLRDITVDKKNILNDENQHAYSKYIVCRFLSMNENYLPIVDKILNRQQAHLSNMEFHKLCLAIIPQKNVFLTYVKGTKRTKELQEELGYISRYFNISENDAADYYEIAGETLVTDIKKLCGIVDII